jgi:hypothetical protein
LHTEMAIDRPAAVIASRIITSTSMISTTVLS